MDKHVMHYRHTQIGWLVLIVIGGAATLFAALLARSGPSLILIVGLMITAAALVVFSTLTVEVADDEFRFHFSFGLFGREIPLAAIARCVVVENSILDGWGIRNTALGKLYNVSGTRGVELWLRSGTRLRVGSDEPQRVCDALEPLIRNFDTYPGVNDPFSGK